MIRSPGNDVVGVFATPGEVTGGGGGDVDHGGKDIYLAFYFWEKSF